MSRQGFVNELEGIVVYAYAESTFCWNHHEEVVFCYYDKESIIDTMGFLLFRRVTPPIHVFCG